MRTSRCLWPALLASSLAAQVSLSDLPALARSRAERLRPAQEKALEPFWADLALDYMRDNAQYLDQRIAQVAALGDGVVPLLLEKLQPVANAGPARNLADNCRRVLERLDPGSFLDALVELARSSNEVARLEAIQLLGSSDSLRAVPVLASMLEQGRPAETTLLLEALARLRDPSVAAQIAPMLGSADRNIRGGVLAYLVAAAPPVAVPVALQALGNETDRSLLPGYVEYFAAVAHEDDAVAGALLPLLDRERLDWRDTRRLVQVLATVAPRNSDAVTRRLHAMLDTGDTGALGLEAALTLRALGDKNGLKKVLGALNEQLKRPQRRNEPQLYEDRANLYFATEDWKDAADDYERVLELSQSPLLQRKIRQQLVRCEARRSRFDKVLKHLKDSGLGFDEIAALGREDAAVQEALARPSVRTWLQSLPRDRSGNGR
jgi:tetratricopeptide (TPR) repeat protein